MTPNLIAEFRRSFIFARKGRGFVSREGEDVGGGIDAAVVAVQLPQLRVAGQAHRNRCSAGPFRPQDPRGKPAQTGGVDRNPGRRLDGDTGPGHERPATGCRR